MAGMKITELDFVRLLPVFMRDDEAVLALSKAVNQLIGEDGKRLHSLRTWDRIGELTEAECDEMAWELDIDWYDSTGMSLDEKRETIKLAQQIKRKRGTKWAVERLISTHFSTGYVQEWFDTNDAPYTFMVLTTNPQVGVENYDKFMAAINAAKNERSHMAGVFYLWEQGPDPGIEYGMGSSLHKYDFDECGTKDRPATLGLLMDSGVETEPEETRHLYGFTKSGDHLCGTYPRPLTVGASSKVSAAVELESARTLVYEFPKCGLRGGTKAVVGTAIVGSSYVGSATGEMPATAAILDYALIGHMLLG